MVHPKLLACVLGWAVVNGRISSTHVHSHMISLRVNSSSSTGHGPLLSMMAWQFYGL